MKRIILPALLLLVSTSPAIANPGAGAAFVRQGSFVPRPRVFAPRTVFVPRAFVPRAAFGVGYGAQASFSYGVARQRFFAPAAYGYGAAAVFAPRYYTPPAAVIYPPQAPCYPPQVPVPVPVPAPIPAPCPPQAPGGCYSIQQGFAPGYGYVAPGADFTFRSRARFIGGY